MLGKARQMMPLIEGVFAEEGNLGATLTSNGSESFKAALLAPFEGHALKALAAYAIDNGQLLAQVASNELQDRLRPSPDDLRRILMDSPGLLIPSFMSDLGMMGFEEHLKLGDDRKLHIRMAPGSNNPDLSWAGFDFDGATSSNTGCPAHQLPLTPHLPVSGDWIPGGVTPPRNFLDQFFRASIDAVLADM